MSTRQFSGEPQVQWLTEMRADRDMILLQDFWFIDANGRRWEAPKASRVDGASIPRPLWTLVGAPYTGDYRRASIVHDVACTAAMGDDDLRRAADRMFFEACREGGCSLWDATVLYVGVRIGAWWNGIAHFDASAVHLAEESGTSDLQRDFRIVSEDVLRQGLSDDPEDVEARTDAALNAHAARKAQLTAIAASPVRPLQ